MKYPILIITILLLVSSSLHAETLDGKQIIEKVSDQMNQKSATAIMKMKIITTSGQEREFIYESWSKDKGDKNVMIYTDPVRVKGQAFLLLNSADDIWAYYPRTDRVRKLASHAKKQKMQGSDFTYEDFGSGNSFVWDFTHKRLDDEKTEGYDCYKVLLTRTEESSSKYIKMIFWVIKENFVPVKIEYYEEDDPELCAKTLIQSDIKSVDNVPTAMKMVMHNNLDDTETTQEFIELKYNVDISDSRFTRRGFYK